MSLTSRDPVMCRNWVVGYLTGYQHFVLRRTVSSCHSKQKWHPKSKPWCSPGCHRESATVSRTSRSTSPAGDVTAPFSISTTAEVDQRD